MKNVNTVRVKMWGTTVGYLHQDDNGMVGFQYDEESLVGLSLIKAHICVAIAVLDIDNHV